MIKRLQKCLELAFQAVAFAGNQLLRRGQNLQSGEPLSLAPRCISG
jgi:hypothetical protein